MIISFSCTMDWYFMYLMLVFAVQKARFSGTALQAQNLVLVSKYLSNIFSRQVDELLVYKFMSYITDNPLDDRVLRCCFLSTGYSGFPRAAPAVFLSPPLHC